MPDPTPTNAELRVRATELGLDLPASATKAELTEAIDAATPKRRPVIARFRNRDGDEAFTSIGFARANGDVVELEARDGLFHAHDPEEVAALASFGLEPEEDA